MTAALKAAPVLGSIEPRLWTPPLRRLTRRTSYGPRVVDWAKNTLKRPLDPWQRWLALHAGELLPNGVPRFRVVLVLASRQNGKTELPVVLSAYWQFVEHKPMILGTSTKLNMAKESWQKAVNLVEATRELDELRPDRWTRDANGEQESWTKKKARYMIAAANPKGGRSLTIHRGICDELREHHDYSAWDAMIPAGNAVRDFQAWALSNAGSDRSVVLNELRESALEFIETGEGDPRVGIFEWSAEDDADPLDIHALAQANPNLNRRIDGDVLLGQAKAAVKTGGQKLTGFKTENMCIRVRVLNPAIDPERWKLCLDPGDLAEARSRVALCLDVAPDGLHATLAAAAVLPDDRVRVEIVGSWDGTDAARRELPGLLARIRPQVLGWLPAGPAASLAADLADRGINGWPPPGVTVEEIRGEVTATCMGFEQLVAARKVAHSDDVLLNTHVGGAEKLNQGDAWRFSRKGGGHCDAAYAAAGAVHLARTLPAPIGKPRLITAD